MKKSISLLIKEKSFTRKSTVLLFAVAGEFCNDCKTTVSNKFSCLLLAKQLLIADERLHLIKYSNATGPIRQRKHHSSYGFALSVNLSSELWTTHSICAGVLPI